MERRGDVFVLNGQKVWSSFAHIADWCILVGLSDPEAPRYKGLTYMAVDMHSPGIEVRPLRQITGESEFNEIFFTDVEVPAANLLGEEGQGWMVAMTTLLHERGTLGFALSAQLEVHLGRLLEVARERVNGDALARDRVAQEWIDLQALRYTNYRALTSYERTGIPGPEGSVAKLRWSEQNQRLTKLGRELLGEDGILDDGWWHHQQLRSRGNTIEAGTSEVLRNIIAERVLNLPRSR
jgi:alkylation response protein AidB-like acyl-CoA dehydrogenase